MAMEIERKFWVRSMAFQLLTPLKIRQLRQGYLNDAHDKTVRVRTEGSSRAWLTVKGATTGCSRKEYEYEIPVEDGMEMLEMCPVVVSKQRYVISYNGDKNLKFEVDVFDGHNKGLVIAEIEIPNEEFEFDKPNWIGDEIRPDSIMYGRVSNSSLAKFPFITWDSDVIAKVRFPES